MSLPVQAVEMTLALTSISLGLILLQVSTFFQKEIFLVFIAGVWVSLFWVTEVQIFNSCFLVCLTVWLVGFFSRRWVASNWCVEEENHPTAAWVKHWVRDQQPEHEKRIMTESWPMTRTRNQEASKLDQTIGSKTFTLCTISDIICLSKHHQCEHYYQYNQHYTIIRLLLRQRQRVQWSSISGISTGSANIYIYIYATEIKTIRILRDKIQSRDQD